MQMAYSNFQSLEEYENVSGIRPKLFVEVPWVSLGRFFLRAAIECGEDALGRPQVDASSAEATAAKHESRKRETAHGKSLASRIPFRP